MQLRLLIATLLASLSIMFLVSCADLPSAPQGNTCIGDVPQGGFDCVPIPQDAAPLEELLNAEPETVIVTVKLRAKADGTFVPFSQVDNWVAFDPETWANIQTYIGDLKVLAQRRCQ